MAKIYYEKDADLGLIKAKKVAVIGFGSQGHAHALNLHDSGVEVAVGLRQGSANWAKAQAHGLQVKEVAEAAAWADVIMILLPDTTQPKVYQGQIAPHLNAGDTLMFAHGFNIRFETIKPPADVDVSMIAPKGPGHLVRETYAGGAGTPALLAVHQDYTGSAEALALSYGAAIGSGRAGILKTTFSEETETDLFGEQAVLCGGVSALVKAGFETLIKNGYQPEVAYFECMHELKLIVDLFYRGGLNYMRYSVSDTAEWGDYTAGQRLITEETIGEMQKLLDEIKDGSFAKRWVQENENGRPEFNARRRAEQDLMIEQVGADLRDMMPFLKPVHIKPGEGLNNA